MSKLNLRVKQHVRSENADKEPVYKVRLASVKFLEPVVRVEFTTSDATVFQQYPVGAQFELSLKNPQTTLQNP